MIHSDVVNIWGTLYKTYRKAHDLIVWGITIGAKEGGCFFPLWIELWRQPGLRKQMCPQRMAAALLRLNHQLIEVAQSLDGIDFAVDSGYHGSANRGGNYTTAGVAIADGPRLIVEA